MIEAPDTMRVLEQHNSMPEKYEPRLITVSKVVLKDEPEFMNDDDILEAFLSVGRL